MCLREIKRKLCILIPAAALFLADLPGILPVSLTAMAAAPTENAKESALCPDSMYVAFSNNRFYSYGGDSTQSWYDLYDSTGKLAGQTVFSPEIGVWAYYMPKGRIYRYTLDKTVYLQNTTTLSVLAQFPEEETAASAGRAHYALFGRKTGKLQIFDQDGNRCLEKQFDAADPDADDASGYYVQLTESADTVLVQVGARGEERMRFSVLLFDDGTSADSTQESFPEIFLQNTEQTLGVYFLVQGGTDEKGRPVFDVCTREGTLIMKGVQTGRSSQYFPGRIDNSWENAEPEKYVFLEKDHGYAVFDESLAETGYLADAETTPLISCGYVNGLPCEALGGAVCEGKLSWCGEETVWGRTAQGVLVWTGEDLISLDLPPEETVLQMNDQVVFTREKTIVDGQEETRDHLRLRSDLSQEFPLSDRESGLIRLQKDSFMIMSDKWWTGEDTSVIYDSDMNQSFCGKGILTTAFGGNYYLARGPYEGLIDPDGNWLIRRYRVKE